jgi:hypothetical protein
MNGNSSLDSAFACLQDALDDYRTTVGVDTIRGLLARIAEIVDSEPLRGIVETQLPAVDFASWSAENLIGPHTSGSRSISWPHQSSERVAVQVEVLRKLSSQPSGEVMSFAMKHFRDPSQKLSPSVAFRKIGTDLLQPMKRDLQRIAMSRSLPTALSDIVRARPRSNDRGVDSLLGEACTALRDKSPLSRQVGLEKLWDAWERAKSLNDPKKDVSAKRMLDAVSTEPRFRQLIEDEARALTAIGNEFRIRHHELRCPEIADPAHVDYLAHRMLAMLQLVLNR